MVCVDVIAFLPYEEASLIVPLLHLRNRNAAQVVMYVMITVNYCNDYCNLLLSQSHTHVCKLLSTTSYQLTQSQKTAHTSENEALQIREDQTLK